jgi:hypothetical protein
MVLGVLLSSLPSPAWAADDERKAAKAVMVDAQPVEHCTFQLASGTTLLAELLTPINSQYTQPTEALSWRLLNDVWLNERRILEKGTLFEGAVAQVEAPVAGRNAKLTLTLKQVALTSGEVVALQANVLPPMGKESHKNTLGGEVTEPTHRRLVRYDVWGIGSYNRDMLVGPLAMGKAAKAEAGEVWRVVLQAPLVLQLPKVEDGDAYPAWSNALLRGPL